MILVTGQEEQRGILGFAHEAAQLLKLTSLIFSLAWF